MRFTDLDTSTITDATVLLDIDGTLVEDAGHELSPEAAALLGKLSTHNEVYLASNGPTERTKKLAERFGTKFLPQLSKPRVHASLRALSRKPRTVVIGDKFLTDGLMALQIGAEFILVESMRHVEDARHIRASYSLDWFAVKTFSLVSLMRPHHWVKNLLVFAPVFFAGGLFNPALLTASVVAFIAFSLVASSVYVLNDLADVEQDRTHPRKKRRPIASGRVSRTEGGVLSVALLLCAASVVSLVPALTGVLLVYLATNILYTLYLKHIAVLDIILVASFYLMRVVAGGEATALPLSPWIILCAFFVALFVIIGKRRAEFDRASRRKVLEQYTRASLDLMLAASAGLALISYGLYTVIGHPTEYLIYSTVFVAVALFRVMNRIYSDPDRAESPERLLFTDLVILGSFVCWLAFIFITFYQA